MSNPKVSCITRGGWGNVAFCVATTIAYSLKHNIPYCIPTKVENPHYPESERLIKPHIFPNVNYCDKEQVFEHTYNEPNFHYTEIPFFESVLLNGYFQSELYFKNYRNEILKALGVPYEFKEGWISLQIRRGDYLQLQTFHPPVTLEYIHNAIRYFTDMGYKNFLVLSDGIEWCYENIVQPNGCFFEFSVGRTELEDISLMSCCEHNICSNSSFGWWGHYLNRNENKIGIFPKIWFGESLSNNDTKDLIPKNAIVL